MVLISASLRVEIYIKDGCSFCAQVVDWLEQSRWRTQVSVHDVRGRPELFARFRHQVPVVACDGEPILALRFTREAWVDALTARLGEGDEG